MSNSFIVPLSIVVVGLISSSVASAKDQYERLANCGELVSIKGKTCKDLEATFSFEKCAAHSEPVKVTNVFCSGDAATATFVAPPYKFEGHMKMAKSGGNWENAGTWERNGKRLRQWKMVGPVAAAHPPKVVPHAAPAPTPAMTPPPVVHAPAERAPAQEAASSSDSLIQVSGFLSPAYHWNDRPSDKGFTLHDSAVYISFKKDKTAAFIDIPIISGTDLVSSNVTAAPVTEEEEGTLILAKQRAQAYVTYTPVEWLTLTMGQFDTLYGFELNDSKDRFFARTGLVYNKALNLTHTGFMATAAVGGVTFKLLGANPNNRSNMQGNNDTEIGGQVSYAINDTSYITAGYLTFRDALANDENTMTDIVAGTRVWDLKMDFEYNLRSLTDGSGEAHWYLGHFLYDGFEKHKMAVRLEFGDSVDAATTSQFQHSIGYRYVENDSFWIQLEVQGLKSNWAGGGDSSAAGATLSALHSF